MPFIPISACASRLKRRQSRSIPRKVGLTRWAGRAKRPQGVPEYSKRPRPSETEKPMWERWLATPSSVQQRFEVGVVAVVEDDEAGVDRSASRRRPRPRPCSSARRAARPPRRRRSRARGAAGGRPPGRRSRFRRSRSSSPTSTQSGADRLHRPIDRVLRLCHPLGYKRHRRRLSRRACRSACRRAARLTVAKR